VQGKSDERVKRSFAKGGRSGAARKGQNGVEQALEAREAGSEFFFLKMNIVYNIPRQQYCNLSGLYRLVTGKNKPYFSKAPLVAEMNVRV
jgi:hypothetical protein